MNSWTSKEMRQRQHDLARLEETLGGDLRDHESNFSVDQFLHEECFIDTSSPREVATPMSTLYRSYQIFATENQLHVLPLRSFSEYIKAVGLKSIRRRPLYADRSERFIAGIRLRSPYKAVGDCTLPTHNMYDGKKILCPQCKNQKAEKFSVDTASGMNKGTEVLEATRRAGKALANLAGALRDYIGWYIFQ